MESSQKDSRAALRRHLETLIEQKCKQMGKTSSNGKCNAVHLEQWMKGMLEIGPNNTGSPILEVLGEDWTPEMLRKRSEELQLIDSHGNMTGCYTNHKKYNDSSSCDELPRDQPSENESPSKSTTTESQVTVRSSPLVPETVSVCRQCHKNCLSNVLSNTNSKLPSDSSHYNCHSVLNNGDIGRSNGHVVDEQNLSKNGKVIEEEKEDWRSFFLVGLCANPVTNLVKFDPFQKVTPSTNVIPSTPENCLNTKYQNYHILEKSSSLQTTSDTDDSPQTEDNPYHSLSSSALTLRRYGTVSSLERLGSSEEKEEETGLEIDKEVQGQLENQRPIENHIDFETDSLDGNENLDDENSLGIDNEAFNNSSILSWTAKAGSYVAEKMAFFERLSEDYRSGGGFFERYLKPNEPYLNGEEGPEEETSGGTSGEEIWGTPTSGGDLDDPPNSPNFEEKLSPNHDSLSDTMDDTEFMMDELLMTPPISGAVLRGLLPRSTLEPLIEEDFSESSSSEVDDSSGSSCSSNTKSSKKGNLIGNAADICLKHAANIKNLTNGLDQPKKDENHQNIRNLINDSSKYLENFAFPPNLIDFNTKIHDNPRNSVNQQAKSWEMVKSPAEMDLTNQPLSSPTTGSMETATSCQSINESKVADLEQEEKSPTLEVNLNIPRSESYRKILEEAEDLSQCHVEGEGETRLSPPVVVVKPIFFENFRQTAKFFSIQKVPKSRSNKIFDFFNVRRTERRIYEQFPENQPLLNLFTKENSVADDVPKSYGEKPISASKILKDKKMDRRFWKQLSKRRECAKSPNFSA